MYKTLLETIEDYDYDLRMRINGLEKENEELKKKNSELLDMALTGVRQQEALMLEAILAGAFDKEKSGG